jgi:hypothetical protein
MPVVEVTEAERVESEKFLQLLEVHAPALFDHLSAVHARLARMSRRLQNAEAELSSLRREREAAAVARMKGGRDGYGR